MGITSTLAVRKIALNISPMIAVEIKPETPW
jgi:hypothetical protein